MASMSDKLREARAEAVAAAEELLAADPTAEVLDAVEARNAEIEDLDKKIEAAHALEERSRAVAESRAEAGVKVFETASVRVGAEPTTYRSGGEHSYFKDLVRGQLFGDPESLERLRRNDQEVRALSTTDTAGGDFVPPLHLVSEYVPFARAQRVFASEIVNAPLPSGTDTIVLPRMTGGTAVAAQSENNAFQDTDAVTDTVTATVETRGGKQVLSLQLIEQSPVNVDQIIMADLAGALASSVDAFAISNNATGKYGALNVSSINSVTYTSTSPTASGLYAKIADGIQQIHSGRFAAPTKIFMHPRRWAFFLAALDSQNRPLVVPSAGMNPMGSQDAVASAGAVGTLQGLPVFLDANIPTNLGSGTNEDRIIIVKHDDLYLWESTPRAEVFRETLAGQGSVLVRLYEYVAVQNGRYPESIAVVAGTGLSTPSF